MLPETPVHIGLYGSGVLQNIRQNALFNGPPEEVELPHGCLLNRRRTPNNKADALTTTERVEQALAVGLELALVLEIDDEGAVLQSVANIELLGIVGDEPFDDPQTHGGGARQKRENRLHTSGQIVEVLEPADNEVLLALNAALDRMAMACGGRSKRSHGSGRHRQRIYNGGHPCQLRYSVWFKWTHWVGAEWHRLLLREWLNSLRRVYDRTEHTHGCQRLPQVMRSLSRVMAGVCIPPFW